MASNNLSANSFSKSTCNVITYIGNTLTLVGCLGILFGLGGLIKLDDFAMGISSGIRVIGTVAIAGCLLSAIGYGFLDFID